MSVTSCLQQGWIRSSTNSSPTLQLPSIHQREVRKSITKHAIKTYPSDYLIELIKRRITTHTHEYFAQVCHRHSIGVSDFLYLSSWSVCICAFLCFARVLVRDALVSFVSHRLASPNNHRPHRSSSNRRSIAGLPEETKAKTPTVSHHTHSHTHTHK